MGKTKMTKETARRIQFGQDKKGSKGDMSFKARTMRAADRKSKK